MTSSSPPGAGAGDRVRAFNRFYTGVIGVLQDGLLETSWSLTEARVIFELAAGDAVEVIDLRADLGLDRGYLSRLLSRLEDAGVLRRAASPHDGRRQVVELTAAGRSAAADLDHRATSQVEDLLAPLPADARRRLLGAMDAIEDVLGFGHPDESVTGLRRIVVLRAPDPGDLGWIVERNAALYALDYGWDDSYEALVARIVSEFAAGHDPARESTWIAEIDGRRAGCVMCVREDDTTARLRLLLLEPWARGAGIGGRLVDECIRFATRARYRHLVLWTNDVLVDARRIYERAGFRLVDEERHHSFGHDLLGQTWQLDLSAG